MTAAHAVPDAETLRRQVKAIDWYHTIELGPDLVTPGWLDHRPIMPRIPLPKSLSGKRCLDVGTFNGYWAFEMERRGAAEVIALDVLDPRRWDWPVGSDEAAVAALSDRMAKGAGFDIARRALGSNVTRIDQSVYDLDPDQVGRFDVVYLGSLLVHLRDPVRALERIRKICDGTLVVVDGIDLPQSLRHPRLPMARLDGCGRPWWWYPNVSGLAQLVRAAGFEIIEPPRRVFVPAGLGWPVRRFDPRALKTQPGRYVTLVAWRGDPHASLVARPVR